MKILLEESQISVEYQVYDDNLNTDECDALVYSETFGDCTALFI